MYLSIYSIVTVVLIHTIIQRVMLLLLYFNFFNIWQIGLQILPYSLFHMNNVHTPQWFVLKPPLNSVEFSWSTSLTIWSIWNHIFLFFCSRATGCLFVDFWLEEDAGEGVDLVSNTGLVILRNEEVKIEILQSPPPLPGIWFVVCAGHEQ